MMKVKIYGAGSIGNHLAQASRRIGWDVSIVDPDVKALQRSKEEIYPTRYGSWDDSIKLYELGKEPKEGFDIIFLGTPPLVRMNLALECLQEKPKLIQLEKPLCGPDMKGVREFMEKLKDSNTLAIIGYDHAISKSVQEAEKIIASGKIGKPLSLDVEFRESWKGIFNAHPWLLGPKDTYLGYWKKGGGAACEHSHATNLWQHFSHLLGFGKVTEVSATLQMVNDGIVDYDSAAFLTLTTESGFVGRVVQDVITYPIKKQIRVQGDKALFEVNINGWEGGDFIRIVDQDKNVEEVKIAKKRPDDFYEEILHMDALLHGKVRLQDSPISIERGVATMKAISAAHESHRTKKAISV